MESHAEHGTFTDLFWHLASQAAIHITNRLRKKGNRNSMSPYQARYGVKPDITNLRIFGCAAYPHNRKDC
eukprot:CAMPEP_0178760750 /NCGR_PEP_ID=MMETSP0744-20121128/15657_1 /TAXON_ID=913974 /ORGANISM="Nitzschia punctata, Strain CCMP561" /LENGTH=69 /DNA_ID=CAMNT_0020415345 /DNA_START=972 /DNA_END=1181 /DNA_ORIENTATION=+